MSTRFVDRKDLIELPRLSEDFFIRPHGRKIAWFGIICALLALTLFFIIDRFFLDISSIGQINIVKTHNSPLNIAVPAFVIIIVLGAFTYCMYFFTKKFTGIVSGSEFQSALFSSVARIRAEFFLVVSKNKIIIYADSKATSMFKQKKLDNIAEVLAFSGLSEENKDRLENAVARCTYDEIPFTDIDSNGHEIKGKIVVDPIARPKGYMALRGYLLDGED